MVRILYTFVFVLLTGISSLAQSVSVSAYVDSSNYLVGDYINYSVEISYPEGTIIDIPEFVDSLGIAEHIKTLPPEKYENGQLIIKKHRYILSVYDSAGVVLPPVKINYKKPGENEFSSLESNEVKFTVKPMEINPQADIQDVKKPVKIPLDWTMILIIAFVVLILIAAIVYAIYYFRKKKETAVGEKIRIYIPPHKEALNKLYILDDKKLWQQGEVKLYHSEITDIIRIYFEKRFEFNAMEMPSSEVISFLENIEEAGDILGETRKFFENADLVKFAKFEPMPTVNEEMMKQALEIVKSTMKDETISEAESVQ